MAWRVNNVQEQRKLFIQEYHRGDLSLSEICEFFNISRPTGYKWIHRFELEGEEGLDDRRRVRQTQPHKTKEFLEERILEVKHRYPYWGPKKIYAFLKRHHPREEWPSTTTFSNILKRNGLTSQRKKKKRFPAKTAPLSHCKEPNDTWCADFKGWFQTKDKIKCDPFTVTDAHSRFILFCSKLYTGKAIDVWKTLEKLFLKHGLPKYFRHDNGPPFATSGVGRLSTLSVNLIKVGIIPEWIEPGKPYQNGRHERMHLTLKSEGVFPLKLTLEEQQMKFKEFISYYNYERPHEAINQSIPSDIYVRSEREWDGKFHPPEYGDEYITKRVRAGGQISWKGESLYIGKALCNEYIGIKESEDEGFDVYYGPILLGIIDYTGNFTTPMIKNRPKRNYTEKCY